MARAWLLHISCGAEYARGWVVHFGRPCRPDWVVVPATGDQDATVLQQSRGRPGPFFGRSSGGLELAAGGVIDLRRLVVVTT